MPPRLNFYPKHAMAGTANTMFCCAQVFDMTSAMKGSFSETYFLLFSSNSTEKSSIRHSMSKNTHNALSTLLQSLHSLLVSKPNSFSNAPNSSPVKRHFLLVVCSDEEMEKWVGVVLEPIRKKYENSTFITIIEHNYGGLVGAEMPNDIMKSTHMLSRKDGCGAAESDSRSIPMYCCKTGLRYRSLNSPANAREAAYRGAEEPAFVKRTIASRAKLFPGTPNCKAATASGSLCAADFLNQTFARATSRSTPRP
jgi:hypothetical protein